MEHPLQFEELPNGTAINKLSFNYLHKLTYEILLLTFVINFLQEQQIVLLHNDKVSNPFRDIMKDYKMNFERSKDMYFKNLLEKFILP